MCVIVFEGQLRGHLCFQEEIGLDHIGVSIGVIVTVIRVSKVAELLGAW